MPRLTAATPSATRVYTRRYSDFRGVDFSRDPSRVEESRSPWAVNLISDGGAPRKRPGWRRLAQVEAPVRGIYQVKSRGKEYFAVHAGDKLYSWDGEAAPVQLMDGLGGQDSAAFMWADRLYILTGAEYIYTSADESGGISAGYVAEIAYAPITAYGGGTISDYENGVDAGEPYEDVNIATRWRRNNFEVDLEVYRDQLYVTLDTDLDPTATLADLTMVTEQGNEITGVLYFVDKMGGTHFRSDEYSAACKNALYIDFPAVRSAVSQLGDTSSFVNIRFPAERREESPIDKCRIAQVFSSRLFLAGNPDYPNADWYSELSDPTYFKDISYTEIGSDSSAICAYLKTGEQLAIIKESSIQDAGVYLRRAEFDTVLGTYFPVRQGVGGNGAIGLYGYGTLSDDPMFLTPLGVMGLVSRNITGERVLQARSTRVNNKLLREDISNAHAAVWQGYLVLGFANGHVYLADSRQKSYPPNSTDSFEYEWFYWQGVPMSCMCARGAELYFGNESGELLKLNTDLEKPYSDYPEGLESPGIGIVSEWATRFDDDGDFMLKKNMTRRGCGIFLTGAERGNVKLAVRTDKDFETVLAHRRRGVFSFQDVDFENFTFETLPRLTAAVNRKVKKYTAIQVICRSDEPEHDFGILGIERRYVVGRYNK